LIFASTLIAALGQGLLIGILVGILTTLFIHYVKSNLEPQQFFNYLRRPTIESNQKENTELYINLKGIVNFYSTRWFCTSSVMEDFKRYSIEIASLLDAPAFVLQQEGWVDKLGVKLALHDEDINFSEHKKFLAKFLLQGPDPDAIRLFFNDDLINYIKGNPYYHIECNGSII